MRHFYAALPLRLSLRIWTILAAKQSRPIAVSHSGVQKQLAQQNGMWGKCYDLP